MKTIPILRFACRLAALVWLVSGIAGATATFTLPKSTYAANENITATFTRDSAETLAAKDWAGIYTSTQTPGASGIYSTKWAYLNSSQSAPSAAVQSGTVTINASGLTVGSTYKIYLLANDGYTQIAPPVTFTIIAAPTLVLDKSSYTVGQTITATVGRTSANTLSKTDWVGIYKSGQTTGSSAATVWNYLSNSHTAPATAVQSGSVTFSTTSLTAGTWVAHFMANDGYVELATTVTFTVVQPGGPTPPVFIGDNFPLRHAIAGTAYAGCIHGYAKDVDAGDSVTYSKVSGPAWLNVAGTGVITGTPATGDAGTASFVIKATDLQGNNRSATFTMPVFIPGTAHVDQVKVLSYNLFHGWGKVTNGARKGLDTIIQSGADVVCTSETTDDVTGGGQYQAQYIAQELGWYYTPAANGGDVAVVSRYPISTTYPADTAIGARLQVCDSPLQEMVVFSTRLDSSHYGPYAAALDGATDDSVMAEETASNRDEQAAALVTALQSLLADSAGTPVVVCGDLGSPSHLDWTADLSFLHNGRTVAWPATVALAGAGLSDTFRTLHPDAYQDPGNTWSPLYAGDEPQDRTDFIFSKGVKAMPAASLVFNTQVETTLANASAPLTGIAGNTWPSDHATVLTTFALAPVDADANNLPDWWETANFGAPGLQSSDSDPNHRGFNNLIAYATGVQPGQPPAAPLVQTSIHDGAVHVGYLRRKGGVATAFDYTLGGLHYHLMKSADLTTWTRADEWLVPDSDPVSVGPDCEQATWLVLPPSGTARQFFKLFVGSN